MAIKRQTKSRPLKKIRKLSSNQVEPKTVNELKKHYRHLPLHFLFGVEKEIEHQCPILDDYISQLEEVKTALEKIRKCKSLEMAQVHAAEAIFYLSKVPQDIDELTRSNFDKLRRTHEQWKQLALEAINDSGQPSKYLKI